ncbi:MAG: hypothetical protein ACPGWR_07755 [Ardenticatenaceae bacterium]
MNRRKLEFLFQEPGLLEAIAFGPNERRKGLMTEGYREGHIPDLMIDLHPDTQKAYCFMSLNFDKTYPAVIWGLRLSMNGERFDVPEAGLTKVSLADAFSWAYAHFILEDEKPRLVPVDEKASLTRQVLQHALAAA